MIRKDMSADEVIARVRDCSCSACVNGCTFGSGKLASGDKEKIAAFLGITAYELEKTYLEEVNLYNKPMHKPKLLRDGKPYGPCVFLKDGKCSIHPVKPLECKISLPCSPEGEKLIQWFLVNHAVDSSNPLSLKLWEEYLKEHEAIEGSNVKELRALQATQSRL